MTPVGSHLPYPKGDLRRMLTVLGAIEHLKIATALQIGEATALDRRTVKHLIEQARNEACVSIRQEGSSYFIDDWGPVIRKTAALRALREGLFPDG